MQGPKAWPCSAWEGEDRGRMITVCLWGGGFGPHGQILVMLRASPGPQFSEPMALWTRNHAPSQAPRYSKRPQVGAWGGMITCQGPGELGAWRGQEQSQYLPMQPGGPGEWWPLKYCNISKVVTLRVRHHVFGPGPPVLRALGNCPVCPYVNPALMIVSKRIVNQSWTSQHNQRQGLTHRLCLSRC